MTFSCEERDESCFIIEEEREPPAFIESQENQSQANDSKVVMRNSISKGKRAIQYNKYTNEDRQKYFYFLIQKMMKPKEAALAAQVNYNAARKWKQIYNKDPERNIPLKKPNRSSSNKSMNQLNEAQKDYLIKYFDENASATIQDATDNLIQFFNELPINKSRVAEFMKVDCNLSLKVVSRHPSTKNSEEVLLERAVWANELAKQGLNFLQNCICLDLSRFDISMRRSRGWSKRALSTATGTTITRSNSQTIMGAITASSIIDVGMKGFANPSSDNNYTQFIYSTMDIIDKFPQMKGFYIVMDNALINDISTINSIILNRGYIPVHFPTYSSELNPLEKFWDILKAKVKRTKLDDTETLSSRIIEASAEISVEDLQRLFQHSVNVFNHCLNRLPI